MRESSAGIFSVLFGARVAFPEYAVRIALYFGVGLGIHKAFFRPHAVLFFAFYADIVPAEFFGGDARCARTEKGVKHEVSGAGACEDNFCKQFFRLLGGVDSEPDMNLIEKEVQR